MSHTVRFDRLRRSLRLALRSEQPGSPSRRRFLALGAGALVAARNVMGASPAPNIHVGVVGAGLAGLACAYELHRRGVGVTLYEASGRAGGRCYSLGGNFPGPVTFPGQVVERGGELIDTLHKTLLGYVQEFGLTLEDYGKQPGEISYYFDGQHVPEEKIVEEFRALVAAMRRDLRTLSSAPSAGNHTPADRALDLLSLRQYLESRGAGQMAQKAIEEAYVAEYGLEPDQQSCLNFLLFIHADRRSKFTPFGVFSDERYHIVEGNQSVAAALAARLAGRIEQEMVLQMVAKTAAGSIELTFRNGARTLARLHDAVVLAIPFTTLRLVRLDASLALPSWKLDAIQQLGYGTNAKMMVGFHHRIWRDFDSSGSSYSDLANHQTTWESNPTLAAASRAVLTDYSGGVRGQNLNPANPQGEVGLFLGDLNLVYPGAPSAATRAGRGYLAHLEHWLSNPLSRGSYTCYLPGQFTSIAGNEGKPAGNLYFAGEHTNSFYEWQGFMEGALLSGLQAANDILRR